MNLVLKVFSPFTADLQIPNSDRVSGVALSLLLPLSDLKCFAARADWLFILRINT